RLIEPTDAAFARNALLELLRLDEPYAGAAARDGAEAPPEPRAEAAAPDALAAPDTPASPEDPLERLLDYAAAAGLLEADTLTHRDLFDTRLMGCLMPRP